VSFRRARGGRHVSTSTPRPHASAPMAHAVRSDEAASRETSDTTAITTAEAPAVLPATRQPRPGRAAPATRSRISPATRDYREPVRLMVRIGQRWPAVALHQPLADPVPQPREPDERSDEEGGTAAPAAPRPPGSCNQRRSQSRHREDDERQIDDPCLAPVVVRVPHDGSSEQPRRRTQAGVGRGSGSLGAGDQSGQSRDAHHQSRRRPREVHGLPWMFRADPSFRRARWLRTLFSTADPAGRVADDEHDHEVERQQDQHRQDPYCEAPSGTERGLIRLSAGPASPLASRLAVEAPRPRHAIGSSSPSPRPSQPEHRRRRSPRSEHLPGLPEESRRAVGHPEPPKTWEPRWLPARRHHPREGETGVVPTLGLTVREGRAGWVRRSGSCRR
jgi:hypothetical protein